MKDNHLLQINPRKTIRCLTPILSAAEINKIELELKNNVRQLLRLGHAHLRFAKRASGQSMWRQRVSRGYYCVYSASKAIRLEVTGIYSTELTDHKKIGDLPADFQDRSRWKELLTKYRADRNLSDYDHSVRESALELSSATYLKFAEKFLKAAKIYLKNRGYRNV
ncbi:MAG: hypothetical protein AB2820_12640 [Candidatus Thiodiazotropha sp.]